MSIADRMKQQPDSKKSKCSIGLLLSDLSESESVALESLLKNKFWGHTDIRNILKEEKIEIGIHPIERHRRGECKCQ